MRLNNRVRARLDAALGSLTLLGPDPAMRLEAAQAVFKSRDPAALPALDAALAKETDAPRPHGAGEPRGAAILLAKADAPEAERVAAVAMLAERGDEDSAAMLRSLPADTPERVKAAAAASGAADRAAGSRCGPPPQNVVYGISLGSVLLLAAIGLAITFGVMGVINMAHGEMVMLGAYTTFVVQEVIRTTAPGLFDCLAGIALPLAFLVSGAVGVAIERSVIRFLYGRPARDAARDLGPFAHPAAGGAHASSGRPTGRSARPPG